MRFRVRRKDLDDSASASTSSGEEEVGYDSEAELALRAKLNAQLSGLLDFSFRVEPKTQQQQVGGPKDQLQCQEPDSASDVQQEDENPEEEAFAFRLFRDEALTHTVVLTNDEDIAAWVMAVSWSHHVRSRTTSHPCPLRGRSRNTAALL